MPIKTLIIIILGLGFLYGLFTIGSPFLLAMIVAIFLEPFHAFLMKYARVGRMTAVTIGCTLFTLLVLGLFYLLGVKVFSELVVLWEKAPMYLNNANMYIHEAIAKTRLFYETLPEDAAKQLQSGMEAGVKALTDALNSLVAGISGYFINIAKTIPNLLIYFIVFIVALYLISFSLNNLKAAFLSLFEQKSRDKVDNVLQNLRLAIFGFLRAQMMLSLLTYVLSLAGLLVLRVDYALAVALLITLVDILPVLGTGSVLVPWAAYNALKGDIYTAVGLLALFLVITVIRRLMEPKILGEAVGIGALAALVSLYVGFQLVGVVGLFLGPIVVIIYQAMRKVGLLQIKIRLE